MFEESCKRDDGTLTGLAKDHHTWFWSMNDEILQWLDIKQKKAVR